MTERECAWCRYCGTPIAAGLACKAHADLAAAEARLVRARNGSWGADYEAAMIRASAAAREEHRAG